MCRTPIAPAVGNALSPGVPPPITPLSLDPTELLSSTPRRHTSAGINYPDATDHTVPTAQANNPDMDPLSDQYPTPRLILPIDVTSTYQHYINNVSASPRPRLDREGSFDHQYIKSSPIPTPRLQLGNALVTSQDD